MLTLFQPDFENSYVQSKRMAQAGFEPTTQWSIEGVPGDEGGTPLPASPDRS